MLRLYFNKHSDEPWSIDSGEGTPELTFKNVRILTDGKTVYNGSAPSEQKPCAWLEFEGFLSVRGESAVILPL